MATPVRTALTLGSNKTSNTTINSASITLSAGDMLVVMFAGDTAATSITWNSLSLQGYGYDYTGNVAISIWWLKVTSGASAVVTMNYDSSTAKAWSISKITNVTRGITDIILNATTGYGTSAPAAVTDSGGFNTRRPDSFVFGALGTEGPSGDTAASWSVPANTGQRTGTTGNPAGGNITISEGYEAIATAGTNIVGGAASFATRDYAIVITLFDSGNEQFAQAQASIKISNNKFAQAQACFAYNKVYDTFTRTTSNGWGTSDDAGDWQTPSIPSNWSTDGSSGILSNSGGTILLKDVGIPSPTDWYVKFDWSITGTIQVTGAVIMIIDGGFGGTSAGGNTADTAIDGSTMGISFGTTQLGVQSDRVALGVTYTLGEVWTTRAVVKKYTSSPYIRVYGKVWKKGTSEPSDWVVSNLTSTNFPTDRFGIFFSNFTTSNTVSVDNLEIRKVYFEAIGQAQASILLVSNTYAQVQSQIKQTYQRYAQAQAQISVSTITVTKLAQAQIDIKTNYLTNAQIQARIKNSYIVNAQTNTNIKQIYLTFAQAQAVIKSTASRVAQANASIIVEWSVSAQTQVWIKIINRAHAQALVNILAKISRYGQALSYIERSDYPVIAQNDTKWGDGALGDIWTLTYPTNIQEGDLLLAIIYWENYSAVGGTPTSDDGWDCWYQFNTLDGMAIMARVATGSETGNFTVRLSYASSDFEGVWQTLRIEAGTYQPDGFPQAPNDINNRDTFNFYTEWSDFYQQDWPVRTLTENPPLLSTGDASWKGLGLGIIAYDYSSSHSSITYPTGYYKGGFREWYHDPSWFGMGTSVKQISGTIVDPGSYTLSRSTAFGYTFALKANLTHKVFSQTQTSIKAIYIGIAQALTIIQITRIASSVLAQSQAQIKRIYNQNSQSQAQIRVISYGFAQTQAQIKAVSSNFAQVQATIKNTYSNYGQTQSRIKVKCYQEAQAQSYIIYIAKKYANSVGLINGSYFLPFNDTFNRTVVTGLGTSDNTDSWTLLLGSENGSVDGSVAQFIAPSSIATRYDLSQTLIQPTMGAGYEVRAKISIDKLSATQQIAMFIGISNATVGGTQFPLNGGLKVVVLGSTSNRILIQPISNGIGHSSINAIYSPSDIYQVVVHILPANTNLIFRYKMWKVGNSEPGWLREEISNTTIPIGIGHPIIQIDTDLNDSNSPFTWTIDDFQIKDVWLTNYGQAQAQIVVALITTNVSAQSLANIIQSYVSVGQTQAQIYGQAYTYQSVSQAQTLIKNTNTVFAQTQALVKQIYQGYAHTQITIKQTYGAFAQAAASIKNAYVGFGQANFKIRATANVWANVQAQIKTAYQAYAQIQTQIQRSSSAHAQAQADIKTTVFIWAQAQTQILGIASYVASAQALSDIKQVYTGYAQAAAKIKLAGLNAFAQASTQIKVTYPRFAQVSVTIEASYVGVAQVQASIKQIYSTVAQALVDIKTIYAVFAQALAQISKSSLVYAQTVADIKQAYYVVSQTRAQIEATYAAFANTQTTILTAYGAYAQAQVFILLAGLKGYAQSQALIRQSYQDYAQVGAAIILSGLQKYAQAGSQIRATYQGYAQANAYIYITVITYAQSQTWIQISGQGYAQAQTIIFATVSRYAQTQALIGGQVVVFAQAQAAVIGTSSAFGQACAYITTPNSAHGQAAVRIYIPYYAHLVADISNNGWRGVVI